VCQPGRPAPNIHEQSWKRTGCDAAAAFRCDAWPSREEDLLSGDNGQLLPVHEGHDAIAGPLCHLHEDGKKDQHSQRCVPGLLVVHQTEAKEEDCLEKERQELRPQTPGKPKLCK